MSFVWPRINVCRNLEELYAISRSMCAQDEPPAIRLSERSFGRDAYLGQFCKRVSPDNMFRTKSPQGEPHANE